MVGWRSELPRPQLERTKGGNSGEFRHPSGPCSLGSVHSGTEVRAPSTAAIAGRQLEFPRVISSWYFDTQVPPVLVALEHHTDEGRARDCRSIRERRPTVMAALAPVVSRTTESS